MMFDNDQLGFLAGDEYQRAAALRVGDEPAEPPEPSEPAGESPVPPVGPAVVSTGRLTDEQPEDGSGGVAE